MMTVKVLVKVFLYPVRNDKGEFFWCCSCHKSTIKTVPVQWTSTDVAVKNNRNFARENYHNNIYSLALFLSYEINKKKSFLVKYPNLNEMFDTENFIVGIASSILAWQKDLNMKRKLMKVIYIFLCHFILKMAFKLCQSHENSLYNK